MVRVSLKEAYDNRDVIAWLMKHQEMLDELSDILNNLPDPDLTNVVLKTGDQTIEGIKTFTDPIISQGGVTLASGGLHVGGDLQVDGDIIQEGSSYETHAEQVFSKNDLIVTREDAVGAIVAGGISGIRVNKYDGVNSLNLGVDSTGTMRVGDLTDEQPLMTRDESEDMTSGALLKWDGVNMKAIAPASNIGTDKKPIRIVNGQMVAVADNLALDSDVVHTSGNAEIAGNIYLIDSDYYLMMTNANRRMRLWPLYVNSAYQGFQIDFGASNASVAGIRVLIDETTNTVKLVLTKTVNEEYAEKVIDTF